MSISVDSKSASYDDAEKQSVASKIDERIVPGDSGPHPEDTPYTEEEAAKVLRKIDWHLMPIMCCVYAIQFVGPFQLELFIADNKPNLSNFFSQMDKT
jgi:hypothetical protein